MLPTGTDPNDLVATATAIVAEELGLDPAKIAPDADLRAVEGADSVKVLRIIARLERGYGIELEDEDVFAISRIDELIAVVEKARAEQTAGVGERR